MNIALVSKATAPGGGASRMAEDLSTLLRRAGHTVDHWVGYYSGEPKDHVRQLHGKYMRRPIRAAHKLSARLGLQEYWPLEWRVFAPHGHGYDIIHVHDTMFTAAPRTVAHMAEVAPTVWTLHDCSPFTGGCLWPLDCSKFESQCGSCPQHGAWPLTSRRDQSRKLRRHKGKIFQDSAIIPLAPSQWMAAMADRSGLFREKTRLLPNGIDTNQFAPGDKTALCSELGLDVDNNTLLVLLASGSLDNPYKGLDYALQALRRLEQKTALLVVGILSETTRQRFNGLSPHATGYIHDNALQARYYAAADVLLYTPLADNHPLTVIEAMACGTPVVGFSTGGVPEIVDHQHSGFLCDTGDVDGLIQGLRQALNPDVRREWSANARQAAVERFSQDLFLKRHHDLYTKLIAERGRSHA